MNSATLRAPDVCELHPESREGAVTSALRNRSLGYGADTLYQYRCAAGDCGRYLVWYHNGQTLRSGPGRCNDYELLNALYLNAQRKDERHDRLYRLRSLEADTERGNHPRKAQASRPQRPKNVIASFLADNGPSLQPQVKVNE